MTLIYIKLSDMKELDELGNKLDAALAAKEEALNAGEGPTTTQLSLLANRRRDIAGFREMAARAFDGAAERKTVVDNFTKSAMEIINEIQAI